MTPQTKIRADDISAVRAWRPWRYLGERRVLVVLAVIAVIAGTAFGWNWLVAAGIAPVLLSVPCLVMCGLGLCMNRLIGRSCATSTSQSAANVGWQATNSPVLDQATADVAQGRGPDRNRGDAAGRTRGEPAEIGNRRKETEDAINR